MLVAVLGPHVRLVEQCQKHVSACSGQRSYQAVSHASQQVVASPDNIVDMAVSSGLSKTLVVFVRTGGLVDSLESNGLFTAFAPADEAFCKRLLAIEDWQLANRIVGFKLVWSRDLVLNLFTVGR